MKVAVIGRFQPYHLGHHDMLQAVLAKYGSARVIIGSSNEPRSIYNPFTATERAAMIADSLPGADIEFVAVEDCLYDDELWRRRIAFAMKGCEKVVGWSRDDETEAYLKDLGYERIDLDAPRIFVGTSLREEMFKYGIEAIAGSVTDEAMRVVSRANVEGVTEEYLMVVGSPYRNQRVSVAADAVVIHGGRVLMVERKGPYAKGQIALPGGFLEVGETLAHACAREVAEETGLQVEVGEARVFDHPRRDHRGRVVSVAFRCSLKGDSVTRAGDDAENAFWVKLQDIDKLRSNMFSDHYDIIRWGAR